jgi:hypothetical protein
MVAPANLDDAAGQLGLYMKVSFKIEGGRSEMEGRTGVARGEGFLSRVLLG